jgi:hypothetical protein
MVDVANYHPSLFIVDAVNDSKRSASSPVETSQFVPKRFPNTLRVVEQSARDEFDHGSCGRLRQLLRNRSLGRTGKNE